MPTLSIYSKRLCEDCTQKPLDVKRADRLIQQNLRQLS